MIAALALNNGPLLRLANVGWSKRMKEEDVERVVELDSMLPGLFVVRFISGEDGRL